MTLREASALFVAHLDSLSTDHDPQKSHPAVFELFVRYFGDTDLNELTSARLRDFLSRWYVEETDHQPEPGQLLDSISEFLTWADPPHRDSFQAVIRELRSTLGRALEVSSALSSQLGSRSSFGFGEFLSSFESGGRSHYDLDSGAEAGTMEGFFRVTRIEGTRVEARELISDRQVWPVLFPADVAALIETGYILNMELIRAKDGWEIADSGFVYPPGTELI